MTFTCRRPGTNLDYISKVNQYRLIYRLFVFVQIIKLEFVLKKQFSDQSIFFLGVVNYCGFTVFTH